MKTPMVGEIRKGELLKKRKKDDSVLSCYSHSSCEEGMLMH